jgi:integrase/recombinase XerD
MLFLYLSLEYKGKYWNKMRKEKALKAAIITYTSGRGMNIRLRGKRLANNTISLFLDYYQGYSKSDDGTLRTKRKVEYLKIYLYENPRTETERISNNEYLTLAHAIRNNRQSDLKHNSEGLIAPFRKKSNFFDYCSSFVDRYQKKDVRMINMAVREFKAYTGENFLTPLQINQTSVKGFRDYLINKYNGETPNSVLARFKKILNAATAEGLFPQNPGEKITCTVPKGIPKEILSVDEIITLAKTECPNSVIKRAFLFCLNTGLRFVDVEDLKFKHIANGQLKKSQLKSGTEVIIDLNETAIKLIGVHKEPEVKVFPLPGYWGCLKTVKAWAIKAGINRNITWTSSRHSFATNLLIKDNDIITVRDLLGHSRVEHTQKYTHVVNALKAKAVKSLPNLDIQM